MLLQGVFGVTDQLQMLLDDMIGFRENTHQKC